MSAPRLILLTTAQFYPTLAAVVEALTPARPLPALDQHDIVRHLDAEPGAPTRLIGFFTPVVVPGALLARLGTPAYNFHPGPPAYPGSSPIPFALYDGVDAYGVTVHVMAERVDSGPIVAGSGFTVARPTGFHWLNQRTYKAGLRLFVTLAPALADTTRELPACGQHWSGTRRTKRQFEAMCRLAPDIAADELERRLASFGQAAPLELDLHGRTFVLKDR